MPFVREEYTIEQPLRAFVFLVRTLGLSPNAAQRLIDKGRMTQNGVKVGKAEELQGKVEIAHFVPQDLGLKPLFVHKDFCVYDKPHHLLTHPKGLFAHFSLNDALKSTFGVQANPVHRLDSLTSGLVVCARHRHSEQALKSLFLHQKVQKTYTAVVRGIMEEEERVICAPILAQNNGRDLSIRSAISPLGKVAKTHIRVLDRDFARKLTLIEARPLTGRTHQIRVHLDSIKHPIVGDCLYGVSDEISRFFLESHAQQEDFVRLLGVPHLMLNASRLVFSYDGKEFCVDSVLREHLLTFFYNAPSESVCH
ncbi:pseudouridine synthase family protein [uncultured Helicobacter sp.]|uniref:pseudouridine synthase family protein n=1 Tax=uncultured Helicobacter sp. TaxID=175537 RepID=UPI001C398DDD|nr:RluA family pseudouridine synthase [Candidatus Helicobacter avicola]